MGELGKGEKGLKPVVTHYHNLYGCDIKCLK